MAVRNDITIDWEVSPRLITIQAPSAEITMQDLYDTLRVKETIQMDEEYLVDGAGKEPLGEGVLVGLTLTLNNALLAFEARAGAEYILCQIAGGNLVSNDANGDPFLSPVYPTAFVTIVQANSSSATLQELSAIQYSSFNEGVTMDVVNGIAGTVYDIGTPKNPSGVEADAHKIAENNGFGKVYIKGNITLQDDTIEWIGHEFIGESPLKTLVTIDPLADVFNCEFYSVTVTGTLDGNSHIENGVINGLYFVDGYIYKCALGSSEITLGTFTQANLFSCYSTVTGELTPTINMNGTGILGLRDYFGGVYLKNYNGSGSHSIDLSVGQVKLDSTSITSGTFVVRGIGKLIDENGVSIPTGTWNGGVTIVN